MSKKVYIETYGCQMNFDDSNRMIHLLSPLSYQLTEKVQEADLILINTCSVREKASHKAHSAIGRYRPYRLARENVILGMTGCQAQAEGQSLLKRFKYLDFVLGTDQIAKLPETIHQLQQEKKSQVHRTERVKPHDFRFVQPEGELSENSYTAFVTIMKGCDNFCSFCIVPYVRGREASRPSDEIIQEILSLTRQGVQEVMLLGQNVNSYGTKGGKEPSFAQLLDRIANETPIKRIRFTTSHPKDVKEDLLRAFKEIPVLAQHLHLPVQSGSNSILEKMYRTYTREEYLEIVRQARQFSPEIGLTTDLIVGFPGETEEDFEQTLSLVEEVKFDSAYCFQYSPRPYTTAGRYFEDTVPLEVKESRLKRLQDLQGKIGLEKNEKQIGKKEKILVEGFSRSGEKLQGRTTHYRMVHLPLDYQFLTGEFVEVEIKRATATALAGIPLRESLPTASEAHI